MGFYTLLLVSAVLLLGVTNAQENCQSCTKTSSYYVAVSYSSWWYRYYYAQLRYRTETYCCYSTSPTTLRSGAARIANEGKNNYYVYGRPEVYYSGEWGTICNYWWSSYDARTICTQMGFAGAYYSCCYTDGRGTGRIWLDYLNCYSNTEWVSECYHNGWGSSCSHSQDAGIRCNNEPRLRITGGSNILSGKLYYYYSGSWRKVCDDYWSLNDATVACRQLGLGSPSNYYTSAYRYFGYDYSYSYWLDNLQCTTDELFLHGCPRNDWGVEDCSWYEQAGMTCTMPVPQVTITVLSSRSIRVKCEMMSALQYYATITGYDIEYIEEGSTLRHTFIGSSSAASFTWDILDRKPYTLYYIKASVKISELGEQRAFSSQQTVRTMEEIPGPLTSMTATATSASTILVTWGNADPINGVIRNFIITYESVTPNIIHSGTLYAAASSRSYTISNLQEYCNYHITVKARNGAGDSAESAENTRTNQAAPSGPPLNVMATETGPDRITVHWDEPELIHQNGEITQYYLSYRNSAGTTWSATINTGFTYHVEDLTPYTLYFFKVAALTAVGMGPYSTEIQERTGEDAPCSPPSNPTLMATSSNSLSFVWSEPPDNCRNGIIIQYTIRYGDDTNSPTETTITGDFTFFNIPNVRPYTVYYARVAAHTSAGMGPFSEWQNDRTLVAPPSAPPTEIKLVDEMCDSITVTWEPPPMENWNGPSVSYIISWKVAGGIPLGSVSVQSSDRSYTIPYLRPYRDYSVRMASENSAGIGIYSNEQTTKTAPCPPDAAPMSISVTVDPDAPNLYVSWQAPPMDNWNDNELTGYTIFYIGDGAAGNGSMEVQGATQVTLGALHERTAYTIQVAAVNAEGRGPYSRPVVEVTSGQPPDTAPYDLNGWLLSSTALYVEWTGPVMMMGELPITSFQIEYSLATDLLNVFTMNVPISNPPPTNNRHSVEITGLAPWTKYLIKCYAINSEGTGPASNPISVQTASALPNVAPNTPTLSATHDHIFVTWQQLNEEEARGVVIGYDIEITTNGVFAKSDHPGAHSSTASIGGLLAATEYDITIAGVNVNGTGPFSASTSISTKSYIPTVPTQFRANSDTPTSIILTWGPPSMPNGPIINYYIRYNATSHVEIPDSGNLQVPGNMEQWTVSGLEEHVLYEFYISAATSAGVGDEVFIFETTLEFKPSHPPVNVMLETKGARSVTLKWQDPPVIHHNSPLTGFQISYYSVEEGPVTLEMTVEELDDYKTGDTYTVVIGNLSPFIMYFFKLAAENDAGLGPYSLEKVATTKRARPPPPENFVVVSDSSSSLKLTWTKPDNVHGILQYYAIQYQSTYPDDIDESGTFKVPSTMTSYSLDNLHPGVMYNVDMWIVNDYSADSTSDMLQSAESTWSELPSYPPYFEVLPITATDIKVTYRLPNTTYWNGVPKQLVIVWSEVYDNETVVEQYIDSPDDVRSPEDFADTIYLNELRPYTDYVVGIIMSNDAGWGNESEPLFAKTREAPPEMVEELDGYINNTNISVFWIPPLVFNGELIGYVIYLNDEEHERLLFGEYTYVFADLEPRTVYLVSVTAFTGAGEGPKADLKIQTGDLVSVVEANTNNTVLYASVGGVAGIVIAAVLVVILLAAVAYARYERAKRMKHSRLYADDDNEIYDEYEDEAFDSTKEGFQVHENQLSKEVEARQSWKGQSDMTAALAGLQTIRDQNARKSGAIDYADPSDFDAAINKLKGVGDEPFVVRDDKDQLFSGY